MKPDDGLCGECGADLGPRRSQRSCRVFHSLFIFLLRAVFFVRGELDLRSGAGRGWRRAFSWRGEVGAGGLKVLDQERGSFEVDIVAGEACGDVCESGLKGGAVVEVGDLEGVVFEHGGDVGTVLVAHELVVHGDGAAAGSVFLGLVLALAAVGWFAA